MEGSSRKLVRVPYSNTASQLNVVKILECKLYHSRMILSKNNLNYTKDYSCTVLL